jgi:mRNA-degrading endonuclease HigB of HigAB toxin-antitoxin module
MPVITLIADCTYPSFSKNSWINYSHRVVYIRFVGTHRQYDAIDAQTI